MLAVLLCAVALGWCTAASAEELFPPELVRFEPAANNPVFVAEGPGHWDVKIRERGWILREDDGYHLWFTGYDGTREGIKLPGYATSQDGYKWVLHPGNPLLREPWVEDMMVVKHEGMYYMFAEGRGDRAQLLTSSDRIHWNAAGTLQIHTTDGRPLSDGPYGTPTAWFEDGTWYLFYERGDRGVWLATSRDLKSWKNVQDDPVLAPGPGPTDSAQIALNQILKYKGRYYACYHGSPGGAKPALWASHLAASSDLIHWTKYPGNPLRPLSENKSSNLLIHDGRSFRLYTMHDEVHVHLPAPAAR